MRKLIKELYKYRDEDFLENIENPNLDRDDYFYLPGKILHIDADKDYLNRCMNFYKKLNVMAYGVCLKEND